MSQTLLPGYNVIRDEDREVMLEKIGVSSIDELIDFIPQTIRLQRQLDLPPPMSEWQLSAHMRELAGRNETTDTHACFLGGGVYDHYIPEVVEVIANRGEFITAYTPYQPEISQGLLRVLADFQEVVGRLFDMPVVNSSVYDGATALAESAWMAISSTEVHRIVVSESIWPDHLNVLQVYMANREVEIEMIPVDPVSGMMNLDALASALESPAAAVIVQTPNANGVIEPIKAIIEAAHGSEALAVIGCYPTALGVIEAPGALGADIVYAEGQCLGMPLAAGGPYAGLVGARDSLVDYLPGRLVGEVKDIKGETALALIKQEREQHVRRHKATSHICSNQALMALRALVYLSVTGETGFRRVATLSAQKAHYLLDRVESIDGISRSFEGAFFNEFCIELPTSVGPVIEFMREQGIHAGVDCSDASSGIHRLRVAVTETRTRSDLDRFAETLNAAIS